MGRTWKNSKCIQSLERKHDERRPLGRPRRKWEDNIKIDLKEVGCNAGNRIDFIQESDYRQAYVRAVINLRVLDMDWKFLNWMKFKR